MENMAMLNTPSLHSSAVQRENSTTKIMIVNDVPIPQSNQK